MDRNVMWCLIALGTCFVLVEAIRNGVPFRAWWDGDAGGVELKPPKTGPKR